MRVIGVTDALPPAFDWLYAHHSRYYCIRCSSCGTYPTVAWVQRGGVIDSAIWLVRHYQASPNCTGGRL